MPYMQKVKITTPKSDKLKLQGYHQSPKKHKFIETQCYKVKKLAGSQSEAQFLKPVSQPKVLTSPKSVLSTKAAAPPKGGGS